MCDGQLGPAGSQTSSSALPLPPKQAAQLHDLTVPPLLSSPPLPPSPWVSLNPGPTMGGCFSKPKPGKQPVCPIQALVNFVKSTTAV